MSGFLFLERRRNFVWGSERRGRVIRTATDCGVIGLLDERFLRRDYRGLFPREWDDCRVCSLKTLPGMLWEFWESRGNIMETEDGSDILS